MTPRGKVNICGLHFRVYLVSNETYPAIENLDGLCRYEKQEIYIRKGLAKEYAFSVLLHECMHGIWRHSGVGEERMPEELFISIFTPHLITLYESAKRVRL